MSPYAARPLPAAGLMSPGLAYRGTPLLAGRSPLGGAPLAASNLQLRGRAAKYAGVVKKMNAAAAAGQAMGLAVLRAEMEALSKVMPGAMSEEDAAQAEARHAAEEAEIEAGFDNMPV